MSRMVAVRFAPSPTGPLHIGGVRTALYNYLFAKRHQGRMILRIEDTDQSRKVAGAEANIMEGLDWLGIEFTEGLREGGDFGPYRQSDRAAAGIYRRYADQLLAANKAYLAFDTPAELDAMRERLKAAGSSVQQYNSQTRGQMRNSLSLDPGTVQALLAEGAPHVLRMNMPDDEEIVFQDLVRGEVRFHSSQLDDKILLKSDGMPTYHLANIVDDHLMEITHVIRGEEWLSSTPLHVMLYRAFGWEATMPQFVHLPLILNPNGKGKMSKRQGDKLGFSVFPVNWTDPESGQTAVGYREAGYEPEAMMNFLALLGWNPGDEEELMREARLIERFSLDRLNHSPTNFNLDKLKWFNQSYLREVFTEAERRERVRAVVDQAGYNWVDQTYLDRVIELMYERVSFVKDFVEEGRYLFEAPKDYDAKMAKKRWKGEVPTLMKDFGRQLAEVEDWNAENLHKVFQDFLTEKEVGVGKVMAPLRLALTGVGAGPGVFEIAALIGQKETLDRLEKAQTALSPTA